MEPELDAKALKRLILARVFALRRNAFTYESLDIPQMVSNDTITTPDGPRPRRRLMLTAHGCKVATCTMCPLPDDALSPDVNITLDNWMNQIRGVIGPDDDVHTLTLFHNGNYFSDREVPPEWRDAVHAYLATTQIKELVVECLPQFVTPERMALTKRRLGRVKLVVAIGLQSSSELVRELCIASTCLGNTFERAIDSLRVYAYDAQVFLMFGVPFLSTPEAIWDLRQSIEYCHRFSITPTVCPMKIAPNTLTADLAARGQFAAPTMQDLHEALTGISNVRIAASLFPPDIDPVLRTAFETLNRTGHMSPHNRAPAYTPIAPDRKIVLDRIRHYLSDIS